MTGFLVRHFVKEYEDVEKVSVRTAYGVLASVTGIFCNVFLCSKFYNQNARRES